jgi:nuclear pore complex protein Nup160
VSLVLETDPEMTWVVCADAISAIRNCGPLEKAYHNLNRPEEEGKDRSNLILTALSFIDVIPDHILQICNAALRPELSNDTTKTDLERIQYFFDKTGFWRGVTEEDCAPVVEKLGQNFSDVTLELYDQILNLVEASDFGKRNIRHPLTEFGRKLVVKAAQENLELQWKVFFSQLILLVHMEFEFDQEEDALHHRFDIGSVYRRLITVLRRLELLRWLSKTELSIPIRADRTDALSSSPVAKRAGDDTQVLTALECSIAHLLGISHLTEEPLAESISDMVANLCAPDSDFEIEPAQVQCFLMRRNRPDLAIELAPFVNPTPFSAYVKGRASLMLRDYVEASILFKKAAIGLSKCRSSFCGLALLRSVRTNKPGLIGVEDAKTDRHSVGLWDETDRNLLYNGMAKYYSHIVSLFEKQKAYSYVMEFSRLALQFVHVTPADGALIKTEMLNRQFNAAIAISHFSTAHSALLAMTDHAVQHAGLRKLVEKMCDGCHNIELIALPFPGLDNQVDEVLSQKCRAAHDVVHGTPYHRVLYSWRISRNDYRGAAAVLMDSIQKLKFAGEGDKLVGEDMLDTPITKQYLLLINALSCVDEKQAWVFCEGSDPSVKAEGKRRVVTLADVRREYQDELDRIAAIQNNQFGFESEDEMEIL